MSIKDFYNAVTPGSSITHGTGLKSEADYIKVADNDICSDKVFLSAELPIPNSTLNKVRYIFYSLNLLPEAVNSFKIVITINLDSETRHAHIHRLLLSDKSACDSTSLPRHCFSCIRHYRRWRNGSSCKKSYHYIHHINAKICYYDYYYLEL